MWCRFYVQHSLSDPRSQRRKKVDLQNRLGIAQQRIKKYRERQKDFRKILGKEISELDPDEIKVKLNQIYDWNDKKQCLTRHVKSDIIII